MALVEVIQDKVLCLYSKGQTDGGWHVKVSLPKQRVPETTGPEADRMWVSEAASQIGRYKEDHASC